MMKAVFNENYPLSMEDVFTGGRWKQNDTSYYIRDDMFDEVVIVNNLTGEVSNRGFNGLISDYLDDEIFVLVQSK